MTEVFRRASRIDLVGEIRALTDAVDELQILLQHVWQNRTEIQGIVFLAEHRPEPTACYDCGAIVPTLAEAVEKNWTELNRADIGGCKYAGVCPDCRRQDADDPIPVIGGAIVEAEPTSRPMEQSLVVAQPQPTPRHDANNTPDRAQTTEQGTLF